jgi:hypothetical protein
VSEWSPFFDCNDVPGIADGFCPEPRSAEFIDEVIGGSGSSVRPSGEKGRELELAPGRFLGCEGPEDEYASTLPGSGSEQRVVEIVFQGVEFVLYESGGAA